MASRREQAPRPTRYDAIAVDPSTGAVTDRINFSDWPLIANMSK